MKLEILTGEPEKKLFDNTIVFVHGAWHGAWCWEENFLPYFTKKGYRSIAFCLRGHGSSEGRENLKWTSISDYVDDLSSITETLQSPPILIGHSMGGFIVQKYLEENQALCAVLISSVPPTGMLLNSLKIGIKSPLSFLKAGLTLDSYSFIARPEIKSEFFSKSLNKEKANSYFKKMQQESVIVFSDMALMNLVDTKKIKCPVFVIGGDNDIIFNSSQIEETAKAYNTKAEVFQLMGHDLMLEPGWEEVADLIINRIANLESIQREVV